VLSHIDELVPAMIEMAAGARLLHNWWQDPTVDKVCMITRYFLRRPDGSEVEVSREAQGSLLKWSMITFPVEQKRDETVVGGLTYSTFEDEWPLTEKARKQAAWIEPGFTTFSHLISDHTPEHVRKLEAAGYHRHYKSILEGLQPQMGGRIREGRFWFGAPLGLRKPTYGNYADDIPPEVMAKLAPMLEPFVDVDGVESMRLHAAALAKTAPKPKTVVEVSMPGKPLLDAEAVRTLNAMVRGATAEFTTSGMTGISLSWPNGMIEHLSGGGLYRINDAAKRQTMEVQYFPRQSEYLEFVNQEKGPYYRSPVRLLPETVEFARGLAAGFESAKLAPSEIAAMRLLAAGGVSEYQGEGRFSSGSWWASVDDPKVKVTSKAMRTLCERGYVDGRAAPEGGDHRRLYGLSETGRARLMEVDQALQNTKTAAA
jgi:hypothetical protein